MFCVYRNPTSFCFPTFACLAGEFKKKKKAQHKWNVTEPCSLPSQRLQELGSLCPGWYKNAQRRSLDGRGVMPWKILSLARPGSEIHPQFFLLDTWKREAADLSLARAGLEIKAERNWSGDHRRDQIWMENIHIWGRRKTVEIVWFSPARSVGIVSFLPTRTSRNGTFLWPAGDDLDLAQQRLQYFQHKPSLAVFRDNPGRVCQELWRCNLQQRC